MSKWACTAKVRPLVTVERVSQDMNCCPYCRLHERWRKLAWVYHLDSYLEQFNSWWATALHHIVLFTFFSSPLKPDSDDFLWLSTEVRVSEGWISIQTAVRNHKGQITFFDGHEIVKDFLTPLTTSARENFHLGCVKTACRSTHRSGNIVRHLEGHAGAHPICCLERRCDVRIRPGA